MLEDPEKFYKEYITKEIPRKEVSAFDVGTYFHTAILEPHLLEKECAVYPGAVRRGKEWDAFKETVKVEEGQVQRLQYLANQYQNKLSTMLNQTPIS